jgi:retron-type reverse transcriptase
MTPGPDAETADGMTLGKIERIIDALRHERYRFKPVRRHYIPKKDGKQRPLGLPSWSDKLVGEVVRLLLEAYYEPQFSDRSRGYRLRTTISPGALSSSQRASSAATPGPLAWAAAMTIWS